MPVDSTAKKLQNAKRDAQRRDILTILKGDYGHFVKLAVLRRVMGDMNHALSERDLMFHLVYLEDKKLVELRRIDVPESGERAVVEGVRVVAAGVDLLDGRVGIGVAEF